MSSKSLPRGVVIVLGALPLAVVVLAPVVASWHGLVAAGHGALGLSGTWAFLVPLVFDAAAAYAAVLALRSVLAGDSAMVDRALVWTYATGSAALNVWYAETVRGLPAALFYGAASVSAVLLWDRTLRALRRTALHERGMIQPPAPHYRLARWVIRPVETTRAWAYGVTEGVSDPATALAGIRAGRSDVEVPSDRSGTPKRPKRATTQRSNYSIEVRGHGQVSSKKEALRLAFRELGSDHLDPALAWLKARGVEYTPSAAYRARNELLTEPGIPGVLDTPTELTGEAA